MALHLRIRRKYPPLPRFFSSSSEDSKDASPDPQPSSVSSYFRDVKARLKEQQDDHHPRRTPSPSFLNRQQQQQQQQQQQPPPRTVSLEEIRKNISEFRRRTSPPPPQQSSVSSQELYKRNAQANKENADAPESPANAKLPFDVIRESLRQLRSGGNANGPRREGTGGTGGGGSDRLSLSRFTDSLRLKPVEGGDGPSSTNIGGVDKGKNLPLSIFGREMKEKNEGKGGKESDSLAKTKFLRSYEFEELGEKLRKLRSLGEGKEGFSLEELNERLVRLKEMEEKEMESRTHNNYYKELRDTLLKIKISEDEKSKNTTLHRLDILGSLGGTPSFMQHPPKEHLVEKYFHPDNMSSSEKLKIELAKVRDEFKISESDCGSARVQVAQLTTKIKHLASVLHKKDKHSRKGLEGMVQRRKRLLKYLRNTDWDSYSMVLSRLGLRDNPELKR